MTVGAGFRCLSPPRRRGASAFGRKMGPRFRGDDSLAMRGRPDLLGGKQTRKGRLALSFCLLFSTVMIERRICESVLSLEKIMPRGLRGQGWIDQICEAQAARSGGVVH